MDQFKEEDLFPPLEAYLLSQGYEVYSEVKHCDVIAQRSGEMIAIELKKGITVPLLIQATQRQSITDSVYVAVPRPKSGLRSRHWQGLTRLLKKLQLGCLLISLEPVEQVELLFHPVPYTQPKNNKKKTSLLKELEGRTYNLNQGGSTRKKLMTAYKEQAIHIACCLEKWGPLSPKQLKDLGTVKKTQAILYDNHYGWFERIGKGLYHLTVKGKKEIDDYPQITAHYRQVLPFHERD
jgi:hypothetical protein